MPDRHGERLSVQRVWNRHMSPHRMRTSVPGLLQATRNIPIVFIQINDLVGGVGIALGPASHEHTKHEMNPTRTARLPSSKVSVRVRPASDIAPAKRPVNRG